MKKQVQTVALVSAMLVSLPSTADRWAIAPKPMPSPTLINACLITGDVDGLPAFYGQVLQLELHKERKNYVEFRTSVGVLALFSFEAQDSYIPGSAVPGQNRSAILEFKVTDIDQEYARLQKFTTTWSRVPPINHGARGRFTFGTPTQP